MAWWCYFFLNTQEKIYSGIFYNTGIGIKFPLKTKNVIPSHILQSLLYDEYKPI